jgi:hypothetical protein
MTHVKRVLSGKSRICLAVINVDSNKGCKRLQPGRRCSANNVDSTSRFLRSSDPPEAIARAKALSAELGTAIIPAFEALMFTALLHETS